MRVPEQLKSRWVAIAATVAAGAVAALAGTSLVPSASHHIGPATISTKASLGPGRTVVRIPPFGTVSANTHDTPLTIVVSLDEVDPRGLARTLATTDEDQLIADLGDGLRKSAVRLGVQTFIGGLIFSLAVLAILPRRRRSHLVRGGIGAVVALGLLSTITATTYRVEAFEEPRFTGALTRAPQIIEALQRQGESLEEIRSRFEVAARRLRQVLALVAAPIEDPNDDTVALLHVSDIHSNPLGVEVARQLAIQFRVEAIIDTGDLTSFGEPIEQRIGELIATIPVPYLFVPGNHDSPALREALAGIPNVNVLEQGTAGIRDLTILGWADPAFTASGQLTTEESNRLQLDVAPAVAGAVERLAPDVLAVHHADLARESLGRVPLVLAGHGHRRRLREIEGTRIMEVGSTGATGLGSFLVEAEMDYEAQVLYFKNRRAVAVDYVRFRSLGSEFVIERRLLAAAEAEQQSLPAGR